MPIPGDDRLQQMAGQPGWPPKTTTGCQSCGEGELAPPPPIIPQLTMVMMMGWLACLPGLLGFSFPLPPDGPGRRRRKRRASASVPKWCLASGDAVGKSNLDRILKVPDS